MRPLELRTVHAGRRRCLCLETHIDACGVGNNFAFMRTNRCRQLLPVLYCHAVGLFSLLGAAGAIAQPAPAVVWSEKTHDNLVAPVAISPDGNLAATAGTNNSIRIANHIATASGTITEGAATAIRFPIILGISPQNGNLATLNWTGGYPSYQAQRRALDSASWVNFGDATTNQSVTLPLEGAGALFRVVGVAQ